MNSRLAADPMRFQNSSLHVNSMKDLGDLFARLLVTHDRQLRRYIAMLLLQHDDVEEVLQRTAVVLWKKFEDYDPERDFLPWATRFAYFEVLNFRKEHARSKLVYTEDVMQQLTDMRERYSDELQKRQAALQDCLAKVSDGDRQLLDRRYDASASMKSLAAETGRTVKAIYRRLDRIRAAITECVDRHVASDS
ncbi:MAG: sigma-70 family RNA polymerase sigma factor [Fuerstiella sp.]